MFLHRLKTFLQIPREAAHPAPKAAGMGEIFTSIYRSNYWGSDDSRSGRGSDLAQTAVVREELPRVIERFSIQTMLDVPCGDFHWMQQADLEVDYLGGDIVPELVEANQARYGAQRRRFQLLDIAAAVPPAVDLIFCRDLLVHFSFRDAAAAISNLRASGSRFVMLTTFTNRRENIDIRTGNWRPLNLALPPFGFPAPLYLINEECTEGDGSWNDKSLGLWSLSQIP